MVGQDGFRIQSAFCSQRPPTVSQFFGTEELYFG